MAKPHASVAQDSKECQYCRVFDDIKGVSRRQLFVIGMAAACAACTSAPDQTTPPLDFDPLVRLAVPSDPAAYWLVWFYSNLRQQTTRLVTPADAPQREVMELVLYSPGTIEVQAGGVVVNRDMWNRAVGAQQVNGRPTRWTNGHNDEIFVYPYVVMDWEYADGAWASLMVTRESEDLPPVEHVAALAAKMRVGVTERLKLPMWFTEPPPGMRVVAVRLAPPNPSKQTLESYMELIGIDHDGRLRVEVSTPNPQADSPSQREGYTTIDGHPAVRTVHGTEGDLERLLVWDINGLVVGVEVSAPPWAREHFAPDGAVGVLRRLEVTADESQWR
jgi:hypothetical protein